MGEIKLCKFFDTCSTRDFIKNMYKSGNGARLLGSERNDYHGHCIQGGHCDPLYGDLTKIENGEDIVLEDIKWHR